MSTLSPIQNHIISALKNAKNLRYSELMPEEEVPNDLFNYHLQFLVKKGLVNKQDEGYSLSEYGVKLVADPYFFGSDPKISSLYKMNVITIVSRKNGKQIEILNQLRKSNPSYGKVGVMGGIVQKGEHVEAAATRKLRKETGLTAQFRIVGMERRIMYVKGELFSDILFPIAYADECSGEVKNTEYGDNMWVPIDEAITNDSAQFDSIKGIITVLEAIKAKKIKKLPFFFTEEVQKGDSI
jgi:hypothetical protein